MLIWYVSTRAIKPSTPWSKESLSMSILNKSKGKNRLYLIEIDL